MSLNWKDLLISLTITPSNRNYNCKQDLDYLWMLQGNCDLVLQNNFHVQDFFKLSFFFFFPRQKSYPDPNIFSVSYCTLFIFRFSNSHVLPLWPAWNQAGNLAYVLFSSDSFTIYCFTSLIQHSYFCLYSLNTFSLHGFLLLANHLIYMIYLSNFLAQLTLSTICVFHPLFIAGVNSWIVFSNL